ncbi:cytochrome P450 [Streptomyces sp. NPDC052109]|uniref:cytochrome P450 n=1 Tax=Streptomyces sp. NPDC052109 TaxID=3155527 RepID=UPI00343C89E9
MTGLDSRNALLAALNRPSSRADPYALLRRLREVSPATVGPGGTMLLVARHRDCDRVLRDPAMSSDYRRAPALSSVRQTRMFVTLDPPDHTRLRRLVNKAFTPRAAAALEPRARAIVTELLSTADPDEFDVVSGLAYPLPLRIICEMLGVPRGDIGLFADWSDRLTQSLDALMFRGDLADRDQAQHEFAAYFADLIAHRRGRDGDDLLSRLVRVEENGDRLTEDELISTLILLLTAGHETIANLIGNTLLALLHHPDQLAALRADPALAAGAVEEALRYDPPVQLVARTVRGGYRIGDLDLPDRTLVLVLLGAAGRDPGAFPDPDRYDIKRGSTAHLAFSAGPHFCLGAALARLQTTVVFESFAGRVVDPELVEVTHRPNVVMRGPGRLVIRTGGIAC